MRKIVVIAMALAISLAGHCNAQSSVKKFEPVSGQVAEKARAEIMQREKNMAAIQGSSALANFFDKSGADDVLIINGDGSLIGKTDQLAAWRSGAMTQESGCRSDYKIDIYDNGNLAVLTYINTIHLTRDGKSLALPSRIWNVYVKQDGQWSMVVHGVSRKGE